MACANTPLNVGASLQLAATWRLLSWVLFGAFLAAGALNMTKAAAGFATNHLADF